MGLTGRAKGGSRGSFGCRAGARIDLHLAVSLIKSDPAVGECEEGVISAHTDVLTCLKSCSALADNDRTGGDGFSAEAFYSEALAAAIATVAC